MKTLFRIFLVISTLLVTYTQAEKSLKVSNNITEEQDQAKLAKIASISQNASSDLTQKPEERKKFSGVRIGSQFKCLL